MSMVYFLPLTGPRPMNRVLASRDWRHLVYRALRRDDFAAFRHRRHACWTIHRVTKYIPGLENCRAKVYPYSDRQ